VDKAAQNLGFPETEKAGCEYSALVLSSSLQEVKLI